MTTYYVRSDGNNANAGTGPTAGAAWQTLAKALGAAGIASGDTLYVAPGAWREAVTVAMTSPTAETLILGDPRCEQFTDLSPGPVVWTNYLSGDTAAPGSTRPLTLAGRDFLTLRNFYFVGGAPGSGTTCIDATTATSTNVTIEDCVFQSMATGGTRHLINFSNGNSVPFVLRVRRCVVGPNVGCLLEIGATNSVDANDYDVDVVLENCVALLSGQHLVRFVSSGGGGSTGKPGGGVVRHCLCSGVTVVTVGGNGWSTTVPAAAYNCAFPILGIANLSASASGQLVENYNHVAGTRSNVTQGANSPTNFSPTFDWGGSWLWGFHPRPFGSPLVSGALTSPHVGAGTAAQATAEDAQNRPRPSGGGSLTPTLGAFERHDFGRKGTALGADAGSGYLELVGPGDHDFEIPVDAASTTISVKVKWDANHADTNKPQAAILHGAEVGWPDETKTATGTAGSAYETLTFTARTPSKAGIVTLRLISRSAAANGIAAFDTVSVTT